MAFTYDLAEINPETGSSPSSVRFLLTDTEEETMEFSDEEIAAVLAGRPTTELASVQVFRTAAQLAGNKARYWGRVGNVQEGGFTLDAKAVKQGWIEIANACMAMADYAESGDVFSVVQGGRESYQPLGGSLMGGDGWLI